MPPEGRSTASVEEPALSTAWILGRPAAMQLSVPLASRMRGAAIRLTAREYVER
jgi:hypothetical protein